jgi:hypothetical protein
MGVTCNMGEEEFPLFHFRASEEPSWKGIPFIFEHYGE